jgi:hydrogenase/urease accessory protein HupE
VKTFSAILLFCFLAFRVAGHEVRPACFSITQVTDSVYSVVWKVPAQGPAIPKIILEIPSGWQVTGEKSTLAPGSLTRSFSFRARQAIGGASIRFDGLEKTLIDVLVTVRMKDDVQYSAIVKPVRPVYILPSAPDPWSVVRTYVALGIEHILKGVDHLLFILALLLITRGVKRLVMTITAFTLAHSITLSLATLGVVGLPGAPVEAVIALSIVFMAVELAHDLQGREGLTVRYPWVVAFTFGLLHGFGFAGALSEIGLPPTAIPLSLFFFNVGVELGQLTFVFPVLGLLWVIRRVKIPRPGWMQWIPPYAIGGISAFWLIQRVVSFF